MNNADMPAMPVPENLEGYYEDPKTCKRFMPFMGLSKREYASIKIIAGLAADPNLESTIDETAAIAVELADALFKRLEKDQ